MSLAQYFPVLVFILIGLLVGALCLGMGAFFGPNRPDAAKNSPYECGFDAFEDARMKFDVRYYLVAILFILFDLEIAFLFPWAVALRDAAEEEADEELADESSAPDRPSDRAPDRIEDRKSVV